MAAGEGVPGGAPATFPAGTGSRAALGAGWRLYRVSLTATVAPFLLAGALGVAVEFAGRAGASAVGGGDLALALFLLVPVVGYVTFASVAVAAAGPLLADRTVGNSTTFVRSFRAGRVRLREMVAGGLFASMLALVVVLLVSPLLVYLIFFLLAPSPLRSFAPPLNRILQHALVAALYGPPMVAFAVSVERRPLREAVAGARVLLRGSLLRVALPLLAVGLPIGLAKTAAVYAATLLPSGARLAAVVAGQVATDALLLPLLAAVSFATYLARRAAVEGLDPDALRDERATPE